MPVVSRSNLRYHLGTRWTGDITKSTLTVSVAVGTTNWAVDTYLGYAEVSDNYRFARNWLYYMAGVEGSFSTGRTYRVIGWDPANSRLELNHTNADAILAGDTYELHGLVSPDEKNWALDHAIRRIRTRKEFPMWATQDAHHYILSTNVLHVLDAYYFSDPTDSLNRGEGRFQHWEVLNTMSGQELRISPSLQASEQIILDAILTVSLGGGENATVDIPDEDWILAGAAAQCYNILAGRSPGKETDFYRQRRSEAAKEFTRLSARYQPQIARKLELDSPYSPVLE